ncbi:MAG: hypothetical protein ABI867_17195 [Kofleriaceae bacterium]
MNHHTVFGDLRTRATAVYRVKTQSSTYLVGFHEAKGRRYVIVRGEAGTDREHVVVRDSDPRIGDRSMFEVPVEEWVGKELEVATMTSSTIVAVGPEHDPAAIAAVGLDGKVVQNPWARPEPEPRPQEHWNAPRPPGFPESPRIVPQHARGTHPAAGASIPMAQQPLARQVVVGAQAPAPPAEADAPYPLRHVLYAENIAALLRSISRREQLFADVDPKQRERLRKSLDDSVILLEQIRRRDRK